MGGLLAGRHNQPPYHPKPAISGGNAHSNASFRNEVQSVAKFMRYGYRRVHVVLQREGWMINVKRTYRLYSELGLQLRNKSPKRRVKAKLREDRCP